MNSNTFWKILFVVFVVAWSFTEINPPTGRDLIQYFDDQAQNKDDTYNKILAKAKELNADRPDRDYGNLFEAVETIAEGNAGLLTNYFPRIKANDVRDPSRKVLQRLQKEAAGQINLGIDLQGGTYFVVGMDTNYVQTNIIDRIAQEIQSATNDTQRANLQSEIDLAKDTERMLTQAAEVLRKRVDQLGVAEPIITPSGGNRIIIQLPGLTEEDMAQARTNIQKAALLEFRIVHPDSAQLAAERIVPPGYERLLEENRAKDGTLFLVPHIVKRGPERGLTGKYVKNAFMSRKPLTGEPEIVVNFNSEGAKIFGDVTREHVNQAMAIVLDGELYSAPNINEPILGGTCVISGKFSPREAIQLANVLENPLEAPVKILEERRTDPSLGADSIRSGINATLFGFVAVIVFMVIYYMAGGLVANVALLLNLLFLMGVLCSIDSTLTLPGIAGILLTIGMAVDANVLIFERIREELNSGKSLRGGVDSGYGKAFSTIFDANITTLIASTILIFFGTGPVKGFGVTLTIGICVSMFTALFVTRLIFDILIAKKIITKLPMLQFGFLKGTHYDFLKYAKPAFILSWTFVVIGVGFGLSRGSDVLGVDFKGGDSLTYNFAQKTPVDEMRSTIQALNIGEPQIQFQKSMLDSTETVNVVVPYEQGAAVTAALQAAQPAAEFSSASVDTVGPSIGREILKTALLAGFLAMFGILAYVAFRYEFSFAIAAIIAIVHDVLMTMGWFCLSGRELSAPMVAAVLTIIGFSINDTIVIFDRIREDLRLGVRGSFKDIINRAVNQTLARTIITSGTTLLSTGALYLFGGGVINDFAFTFLIGVITGTFSSIFIAAFIVWKWHKGEKPKAAPQVFSEGPVVVPGA